MTAPLPRTAAEPMAFTGAEFCRGALAAWLWFLALNLGAWTVIFFPAGGLVATIYAAPFSVGALLVCAAPAWSLGRALRRTTSIFVHMGAFAGFGVVVGLIATTALFVVASGRVPTDLGGPVIVVYGVNLAASVVSVVLGWRTGARAVVKGSAAARTPRGGVERSTTTTLTE